MQEIDNDYKIEYKYLITYNPKEFNGVLFIMKEPNAGSDAGNTEKLKDIRDNNLKWFLNRIAGTEEDRLDFIKREKYSKDM